MSRIDCILITGGYGFIGSKLTQALENDLPIVVVDNLLKQVHPDLSRAKFQQGIDSFIGDINDPKLWNSIFEKYVPRKIIHLAAETSTGVSAYKINVHTNANINGLAVLLTSLTENNLHPDQFILASSRSVYGEGIWIDSNGSTQHAKPREYKDLKSMKWLPRSRSGSNEIGRAHV